MSIRRLARPNPLRAQLLALLLALPALSMTRTAAAATFCVNSEATAQAALTTAATNGQADIIRFRSGTITLTQREADQSVQVALQALKTVCVKDAEAKVAESRLVSENRASSKRARAQSSSRAEPPLAQRPCHTRPANLA